LVVVEPQERSWTNTRSLNCSVMAGRGSWERVDEARRQARLVQGKDPYGEDDAFSRPNVRRSAPPPPPSPSTRAERGTGVGVLFIGEAAARLGMSRAELEAMMARGQVGTLPTGFVRVIPTSEVERLQRLRS
jgi:hypothetical protein